MNTNHTDAEDVNGNPPILEGTGDDGSRQQYDDDLHFLRSALSPGEEPRVDVAAVRHRAGRIVRRRVAFRAVAAAAGILVATALLFSVVGPDTEPAPTPVARDDLGLEFIRSAVAELEHNLDVLEREITQPRQALPFHAQSDFAASIWIATATESFEEETAAMLLTAALHRQDAANASTRSRSRFEEIVSYFPDTSAATAAREQISKLGARTK